LLAETALAAGFCDQSHFSRVFKRLTGMTPAHFHGNLRHPKFAPLIRPDITFPA
jgi:AraC-like DNA-binding protein